MCWPLRNHQAGAGQCRLGQAGAGQGRLGQAKVGGRRGKKEEVVHISASIRARAARNFVQKEPCATAAHAVPCSRADATPRTAFWQRGHMGAAPPPAAAIFATAKLLLQRPDGGVVDYVRSCLEHSVANRGLICL